MRLLIVGGSGYVAGLMRPGITEAGHQVRVLDPLPPVGAVDWVRGSATDPVALATALDGMDAVVHAAMGMPGTDGTPDPVSAFCVLVASVFATLAAAAQAGVGRAVLISSISVFANDPPVTDRLLDESFEPDATDVYGLAKRFAEQVGQAAARQHGMTVTALRLGWPTTEADYPAWALPGFPEPAVIRCADGTPIPALAASDLAAAVLAALERDGGGFEAVHILGDDDSGRCWSVAKARELLGWLPRRR
ncbi:MAG: hypothetical protein AUG49_13940 [Catenulispora sp. 13_1_20CM_3_70_7]|nr:MAG: hypothetical protein AUG49_13940 [Catenulispora sp. 13_1_20CM_3_70_7]